MLIEALNPIKVDGEVIVNSIRVNFVPHLRQLRAKLRMPTSDGGEELLDIVVRRYGIKPSLKSGIPITMTVEGEELESDSQFRINLIYEVMKDRWIADGTIGTKHFSSMSQTIIELLDQVLGQF